MRSMSRGKKKSHTSIGSLPQDLIVEVVVRLASASPTPITDLKTLRSSCKLFYEACKAKEVGRCMAVRSEWPMHWSNKNRYLALLDECARCGNLDANYIFGLEEFYNLGRRNSGIGRLWRAMAGGHQAAAYMLGMILFRDEGTRSLGVQLLNRLASGGRASGAPPAASGSQSGGDGRIMRCRREALMLVREMTFEKWRPLAPGLRCGNRSCGSVEKGEGIGGGAWVEERPKTFCSPLCMWAHEYSKFVEKM